MGSSAQPSGRTVVGAAEELPSCGLPGSESESGSESTGSFCSPPPQTQQAVNAVCPPWPYAAKSSTVPPKLGPG